jgi:quinol monooxygenase YgiN
VQYYSGSSVRVARFEKETPMAIMVLLEIQAKEGTGDKLLATFKEILPDTRSRDGFLDLVVHQNQDDKDNLVLVEKWETKAAYDSYIGWRQETGVLDEMATGLSAPPSMRYFDITDA